MTQEFSFDEEAEFLDKLRDLVEDGVSQKNITVVSPYPLEKADEILDSPPSRLRFFTLIGAITGLIVGFAFTIYTVQSWPLITGGKPHIATPAFLIIAFELTILFGALASFVGFLLLAKLPQIKGIIAPKEYGNQFVILVESEE